jgi:MFS transporter, OFA family, oxalate/formate antiporter
MGYLTKLGSSCPDNLAVPNRWQIAGAAFFMQLALGSVYGWSVFLNPLAQHYGVGRTEVNLAFTITLVVLGITAAFGGYFLSRFGPQAVATVAGILSGSGIFLSGLAPNIHMLYLTYGLLGGVGLGLGYIVPLATLMRWFPDRRGFITGLAVAGFGLGAFVTSPIAAEMIKGQGVQATLNILGVTYLVMVIAAARFLRPAPENYTPPGWTPAAKQLSLRHAHDYTLMEALCSPRWYLLWSILALNVAAGAALISVAAPMAQEFTYVDATAAALLVSTISIFNGAGRLFWGSISDRIGRPATFLVIFMIQIFAFVHLASVSDFGMLMFLAAVIALCYGGGFGVMPAFAADIFGSTRTGTIYGAMLTAWSAGAIVGPILISSMPYRTALLVIAGIVSAGAVASLIAKAVEFGLRVAAEQEVR